MDHNTYNEDTLRIVPGETQVHMRSTYIKEGIGDVIPYSWCVSYGKGYIGGTLRRLCCIAGLARKEDAELIITYLRSKGLINATTISRHVHQVGIDAFHKEMIEALNW